MITPTTADPGYIYGPDDYFAFVESIDPLTRSKAWDTAVPDPIDLILTERRGSNLPPPGRALWLDCVQSQYFMRLPWKDERCVIDDREDSERRRKLLQSVDPQYFRAVLLLANAEGAAERGTFREFERAAWHRIVLANSNGLPAIVATDFELGPDGRELRHLRYLGRCSDLERKSLANAFSLDFLPTAQLKGLERGDPNTPPTKPTPKARVEKEVEVQVEKYRYEEPAQVHYQRMVRRG